MADKDFKTIEEQLEILRSRGLTLNDESQVKDFLLHSKILLIFITLTMNSGTSSYNILK